MKDFTIYVDRVASVPVTVEEAIALAYVELRKSEDLQAMGYVTSNGVNLADHAQYMTRKIAELERMLE